MRSYKYHVHVYAYIRFSLSLPLRHVLAYYDTDHAENIGTPCAFPETRFIEAIRPTVCAKNKNKPVNDATTTGQLSFYTRVQTRTYTCISRLCTDTYDTRGRNPKTMTKSMRLHSKNLGQNNGFERKKKKKKNDDKTRRSRVSQNSFSELSSLRVALSPGHVDVTYSKLIGPPYKTLSLLENSFLS